MSLPRPLLRVEPFAIRVDEEILSDLRARERELNAFAHFRAELDGVQIHFVHQRSPRGQAPSIRDYYDNRWFGAAIVPQDLVRVPTAVAVFANQFLDDGAPPREWAERLYAVRRWTPMARGGHFAPAEEPELLARDIAAFFAGL